MTAAVSVAVTLLLLRVDVAAYVARVETLGVGRHDAQTVPEPTLAA